MKERTSHLFRGADGKNYFWPFALITTLFFLWGFAHSILDVLNKHFQISLNINKTESAYVQAVVYGGYFLMAIPAGLIIKRFGYRAGVLTGLCLYGIGALLFIPGGELMSYPFFLFSLFIIGCGLTCLETAANPYVTVLGNPDKAESRINLSQSFNGLGWIVGPLAGSWFLFSQEEQDADISMPYTLIGIVVLLVALIFSRIRLPEVRMEENIDVTRISSHEESLWKHRNFVYGLIALFLYVAAQTGINSFFINYVTEGSQISNADAATMLAFGGMGLFMVGRMGGSWLMSRIAAERVLLYCAIGALVTMCIITTCPTQWGIPALICCYLCESIMFPTIFAISLRGISKQRELASSLLIMCIVGGAVAPVLMGAIADHTNMAYSFIIPLMCFIGITAYALHLKNHPVNA